MSKKFHGRRKVAATSIQVGVWWFVVCGLALGKGLSPASSCTNDAFEVQLKPDCPASPDASVLTFERARNPTLAVMLGVPGGKEDSVFASFGLNPFAAFPKAETIFSVSVDDATTFFENSRQKVRIDYPKGRGFGRSQIEILVCDDPSEKCASSRVQRLSTRAVFYQRCHVPKLVWVPVYSGCR